MNHNLQLESCPKWTDAAHNSEASLFRKSPEYLEMVSQMSKRLGFLENITDSKYTAGHTIFVVIIFTSLACFIFYT